MKSVSAAEANRSFSKLLRDVDHGETILITSHGRPVARLVPATPDDKVVTAREAARERLLARLRNQPARGLGSWRRQDAYEDDPS